MTPTQRLEASTVRLLAKFPFFGALLMQCDRSIGNVPTACAGFVRNRPTIVFGEAFLTALADHEVDFVQAHEVMHIALDHQGRRGSRDKQKWNVAADYAINDLLILSGMQMPTSVPGLHDERYRDLSADQIYPLLPDGQEAPMEDIGEPGGGDGDGEGGAGKESQPTELLAKDMLSRAATIQRMTGGFGSMPEGLRRLVEATLYPKVRWQDVLREFFNSRSKNDFSYRRPSRRGIPSGLYLPICDSLSAGCIAVLVDTSGSEQTDEIQGAFLRELCGVQRDTKPERLLVASFDTTVHSVYEFGPMDEVPYQLRLDGGGGTAFDDALRWAEQQGAEAIVVLTDLQGSARYQPSVPVLWACRVAGVNGPFGTTIHVEV